MGYTYFILCALVFSITLNILYFTKKHIDSSETKVFSILLFINFLGLIIELVCAYIGYNFAPNVLLARLFTKVYLTYLLTFLFLMTLYIYIVCYVINKNPNLSYFKKLKNLSIYIFIFCELTMLVLPITTSNGFAIGKSVNFVYDSSTFCILLWIIPIVKNRKNIAFKKFVPFFCFAIFIFLVAIIQKINPHMTLVTTMEFLIIFIMYFTIENPDLKMVNELNLACSIAEKANNAKTDFLSNMSHEIRTPLNAIVGYSQLVLEEKNIPDYLKEDVSGIITASKSLLEIVNGILDVSKIEANKIEIINNAYDTNELFNEVVTLTKSRIGTKNLEFKVKIDESIPKYLYGDSARIKQIMINLLTNSIKYTRSGFVELKIDSVIKNGVCRLIVSVEDSGVGIKKEDMSKLFVKFERFDESNTTIEGTGLGLAITKKLVDLMKGKIVVQSVFGEGSKFTFALDQLITNKVINKKEEEITISDYSNKKVLVVDDNKVNLKIASKLLNTYKVNVTILESGIECLNKIKEEEYDLIFLDDMMPKMSGVETLKKLHEDPNFKIPVVVLTANALSGMREKYLNDGFDDYLAKPIIRVELSKIIKKFLG